MNQIYNCLSPDSKIDDKGSFAIALFEAAGSDYQFSSKGRAHNPSYARHIFNESYKITGPIKKSFVKPDEIKLSEFFVNNLSSRKMRTWFCDIEDKFKYDSKVFCLALAQEFYFIVKDERESSEELVRDRYHKLYWERHDRLVDEFRKVLKTSDETFNTVFNISKETRICSSSKCSLKIKLLTLKKIQRNSFVVTDLVKYLRNNVVSFVGDELFGVSECRHDFNTVYEAQEKLARYKKEHEDLFKAGFGEIMVSLVIENIVGAPKLFNRIQLLRNGGDSIYESVHLNILSKNDIDYFQLIFGVSGLNNDIRDSIREAFRLIDEILDNDEPLFDFLYKQIMNKRFAPLASEMMMKYLINPSKTGLVPMDEGFGVFISYSPSIEKDYSIHAAEYENAFMKKLEEDMKVAEEEIRNQVEEGSYKRPINFYFMPLDSVEEKGPKIFSSLLSGGR